MKKYYTLMKTILSTVTINILADSPEEAIDSAKWKMAYDDEDTDFDWTTEFEEDFHVINEEEADE